MTQVLDVPATAGLPPADVIRLSGQVRALVADATYAPLPSEWNGAPAFDASAVSHLLDVRGVISAARLATGVSALLLALYVAWSIARRRFDALWAGLRAAAALLALSVAAAVVAAFSDFGWLFTAFHGLFFAGGTWTFPADSLLIRLFPERFWAASGAAWGALALAGAALLLVAARLLRATAARLNASRTANNVYSGTGGAPILCVDRMRTAPSSGEKHVLHDDE
jgi:uncharacterized protein DUF1461